MENRYVPKFTSFKAPKPGEKRDQRNEDRELAELKRRRDNGARDRHIHHRSKEDELITAEPYEAPRKISRDAPLLHSNQSELFAVDRKGDQDNVRYGSNKSASIPLYRQPRRRMLLGENRSGYHHTYESSNLLRNLANDEKAKLHQIKKKVSTANQTTDLGLDESKSSIDKEADFISLRPLKRRRLLTPTQTPGSDTLNIHENEADTEQRGVKDSGSNEASEESETETDNENDFQTLKDRRARLLSRTKSNPNDAQNWLDFISFQDEWIGKGEMDGDDFEISDRRPVVEIKLSIYKDALRSVGLDAHGREQLLMGNLAEAEKVYSRDRLRALWQDTVKKYPGYHKLFIKYLEYVQSNSSDFGYGSCRDLYLEHFKRLQESVINAPDESQLRLIFKYQIYAMLRVTSFLRNCGYQELALAIWQALLEINCMATPESSCNDKSGNRSDTDFEQFWDSEKPRIGEEQARGWTQELAKTIELPSTSQQNQSLNSAIKSEAGIERWLQNEAHQMAVLKLPIRSTDEGYYSPDDPFRVIFFADVEPFLILNRDHVFIELLIQGFLCFANMPPLPVETLGLDCSDWWKDGLLISPTSSTYHYLSTSASLFDPHESVFAAFGQDSQLTGLIARTISVLLRSSAILASTSLYVSLAEYHVAHLVHSFPTFPKLGLKVAQSALKARPSSLRLYNAYALTAAKSDEPKSSLVFTTAIANAASLGTDETHNNSLLYENWVRLSISSQDRQTALGRLATYPDNRVVPKQLLDENLDRVHQLLLDIILKTSMLSQAGKAMELAHALIVLTFLAYARTSCSLQAALDVYSDHLTPLHYLIPSPGHSYVLEAIHEARVRLIRHHTSTQAITSPRTIRDALEDSIKMFPANPLIRGVWRDNESRFLFDEHVRRLAKQAHSHTQNSEDSLAAESNALSKLGDIEDAISRLTPTSSRSSPWMSSSENKPHTPFQPDANSNSRANLEPKSLEANTASINTALSLFMRTLKDPTCRRSPAVWVRYLIFLSGLVAQSRPAQFAESGRKTNTKRLPSSNLHDSAKSRLRDIFYEALNAVPSSKQVALFAFDGRFEVAGLLSEDEKRQILEIMEDRGLRFMVVPPL